MTGIIMIEPGGTGGIHMYVRSLATALRCAGHDVTLCSPAAGIAGVNDCRLPGFGEPSRSLAGKARSLASHGAVASTLVRAACAAPGSVVHWQWPTFRFACVNASLLRRRHPTVVTVHNVAPHDLVSVPEEWRHFYACADVLICHTDSSAGELRRLVGGDPRQRITVIPHGIGDEAWSDEPLTQGAARELLRLPRDIPIVLALGSVRPYKNLTLLLDAWTSLGVPAGRAMLVVAGHCDDWRPYRALARRPGVQGTVELREGWVPEALVPVYLCAASAVALPYERIDASGVAAAAAWCSTPLMLSDVPGFRDAWSVDEALFVASTVAAWHDALSRVVADAAGLQPLAAGARLKVTTGYSWQATASAHEAAYALAAEMFALRRARAERQAGALL